MILYAAIRSAYDSDDRREIQGEGADYDAAHAALRAQIPEGWQVLGIARWAPDGI